MQTYQRISITGRDNEQVPVSFLGDTTLLDLSGLAVVGPRQPIAYTVDVTEVALRCAGLYDLCIISGGAEGVDEQAHCLALELGLPAILVIGSGIDRYMQSTKASLARKIINAGGLILSQFSSEMKPARWTFPQRNKLIAHISSGIFCPAAGEKSGSMSTIRHGIATHTPVWSVPGPLREPTLQGTNELSARGLIALTTSFHDMLGTIALRNEGERQVFGDAKSLISALVQGINTLEQLRAERIGGSMLHIHLLQLQSQGIICQQHNGRYVVIDPQNITFHG